MEPSDALSFESRLHLHGWLELHHRAKQELWVRIFKKGSGTPSVTWDDCVVVAIALPEEFLAELQKTAKREETRKKRVVETVALLAHGKVFY